MKIKKLLSMFAFSVVIVFLMPAAALPDVLNTSTVDHSKLAALDKDFKTVEEVTKACLGCHNLAAGQFKETIHWKWEIGFRQRLLGKRHVINNY